MSRLKWRSMTPPPLTPPPRSVLIVRLSAIGDAVFCTALADSLKAAWPAAEIDWLGQAELAGLLEGHPALEEFVAWPKRDWLGWLRTGRWTRLAGSLRDLRRRLRAREYDLVIDAQGLAKSRVLARLAGGRRRVGFPSREGLDFLVHEVLPREGEPGAFAREYRALAERLTGRPSVPGRLPLRPPGDAEAPFVALLPFTTRPQKAWPARYWTELARVLVAGGAGRVVVFGGPGDRDAAQAMFAGTGVENRAGLTTLAEALAGVQAARAVVGVDTGLAHAAAVSGRPVVVLMGASVPYARGPEGGRVKVLREPLACSPCGRAPTCAGRFDCMVAIPPARVLEALAALADEGPAR